MHTNIEQALTTLKLNSNRYPFERVLTPQSGNYLSWLKQELVQGHPVVWFIMCSGDRHNSYDLAHYDHIEPVFGIFSNRSLTDPTVYGDDVLVHGSDWDTLAYYRRFDSLVDSAFNGRKLIGNCSAAVPYGGGPNEAYPCVMNELDYGWAITGLVDPLHRIIPTSLVVNGSGVEPRVNTTLIGIVSIEGMTIGRTYKTFRFDGIENFPVNSQFEKSKFSKTFTINARSSKSSLTDPTPINSGSAVYYVTVLIG